MRELWTNFWTRRGIALKKVSTAKAKRLARRMPFDNELENLLAFLGLPHLSIPPGLPVERQLAYVQAHKTALAVPVWLEGDWQQRLSGSLLAITRQGAAVALYPQPSGGYVYYDRGAKTYLYAGTEQARQFRNQAWQLTPLFPIQGGRSIGKLCGQLAGRYLQPELACLFMLGLLLMALFFLIPCAVRGFIWNVLPDDGQALLQWTIFSALCMTLAGLSAGLFQNILRRTARLAEEMGGVSLVFAAQRVTEKLPFEAQMALCRPICGSWYWHCAWLGLAVASMACAVVSTACFMPQMTAMAVTFFAMEAAAVVAGVAVQVRVERSLQTERARQRSRTCDYVQEAADKGKPADLEDESRCLFGSCGAPLGCPPAAVTLAIALLCFQISLSGQSEWIGLAYFATMLSPALLLAKAIRGLPEYAAAVLLLKRCLRCAPFTEDAGVWIDQTLEKIVLDNVQGGPLSTGVRLGLRPGDRIGILGGSGAGKTALLDMLCGELEPESGAIYVNDCDLRTLSLRCRDLLFQRVKGTQAGTAQGQLDRVARAIQCQPDVLAVDPVLNTSVFEQVKDFKGIGIFFSSRLSLLKGCDRIYQLKDGTLLRIQ